MKSHRRAHTGTILRLWEQKLNDFSVGEAKIGEKQSRQSNSKNDFMQYVFFSKKGISSVQWDLGQSPRNWGIFENFCDKSNLTVCKVTFNCKLQIKLGEQDVLVASPIMLLLLPRFPRLCQSYYQCFLIQKSTTTLWLEL